MKEKHLLAVIIPFYLGEEFIGRCLNSLVGIEERHIYISDNSPQRFNVESSCTVFRSEKHKLGFGAAVNYAFKQIDSDLYQYILVLNQDAYFQKGHFPNLLHYLQNHPSKKFISPMVYTEDFEKIMPFIFERYFKNLNNALAECFDIDDFVAVSLVIPVELMIRLKGFDTDFFMYYEDTDLIARAKIEKPVRILKNIHVGHHNPDLKKSVNNKEKQAWIEKSRLLYLKKHKSGVIWRIAVFKSRLRKWKNAIFANDLRNDSNY